MRIKWYGHSSFLIELKNGLKILTDPYNPNAYGGAIRYTPYNGHVDIVLISHSHDDHSYRGYKDAVYIDSVGPHEIKNLKIQGIPTFHDQSGGKERGNNIVFKVKTDEDIIFSHLGDLGCMPTDDQIEELKESDIVFIPVGGTYTIDGTVAARLVEKLQNPIVIPMHYKTQYIDFPIEGVDRFLKELGKECDKVDYLDIDSGLLKRDDMKVICFSI